MIHPLCTVRAAWYEGGVASGYRPLEDGRVVSLLTTRPDAERAAERGNLAEWGTRLRVATEAIALECPHEGILREFSGRDFTTEQRWLGGSRDAERWGCEVMKPERGNSHLGEGREQSAGMRRRCGAVAAGNSERNG